MTRGCLAPSYTLWMRSLEEQRTVARALPLPEVAEVVAVNMLGRATAISGRCAWRR